MLIPPRLHVYICIFLLISFRLNAQNSQLHNAEIIYLDSLLFTGQLEQAKKNYIKISTKMDFLEKNNYAEIFSFFSTITELDSTSIKQLIIQYNSFKNKYTLQNAGEQGTMLYTKYSLLANNDEYLIALKYFKLASYFRVKYLKNKKRQILLFLDGAYNSITELEFLKSSNYLSKIDTLTQNIHLRETTLDSIARIRSELSNQFKKDNAYINMWKRDEVQPELIKISLSLGVLSQNSIKNATINIINKNDLLKYSYNVEYLRFSRSPYFNLSFNYKIQEKLYAGAGIGYTEFQYHSKYISDLIFFKFYLKMITSNLQIKYVFREKIGLKPYIEIGVGFVNNFRPQSDVLILNIPDEENSPTFISYYKLEEKTYNYSQLLISLGIDYLYNQNSNWTIGFYSSVFQGINIPTIVGSNHFLLSFRIGYIL